MITDRDITKLKSVFATKEDFERFATKGDLGRFATKEDLERFATKEDFKDLKISVVGVELRMGRLEYRMDSLEGRMDGLDEKMDSVMVNVSDMTENYVALRIEEAAGGETVGRHTRQLEALSVGTGIKLPD